MKALGLLLRLILWDVLREVRRKEAVPNMILFAVLVLFLINLGVGPLFDSYDDSPEPAIQRVGISVGPVLFWVTVLFAGTVGLSQSFAAERDGNSLTGVVLAPIDLGVFYLAKVFATWIYVLLMEFCLLGVYVVLFHFDDWRQLGPLAVVLVVFSLGYMAAGIVLAAMTTALKGSGEVVLRILLFPLLIPLVYLTLRVREGTFGVDVTAGVFGPSIPFSRYVAVVLAIDAMYLAAGFLLFPKVLEE